MALQEDTSPLLKDWIYLEHKYIHKELGYEVMTKRFVTIEPPKNGICYYNGIVYERIDNGQLFAIDTDTFSDTYEHLQMTVDLI